MQIQFPYISESIEDEKTNPGIPAICSPEYIRLLNSIPKEYIANRAYFIWKTTGCQDQIKNWHDAEHQLVKEARVKEKEEKKSNLLPL
jgi:hypothetical protein